MADFLNQHPGICMSQPKEPGYFATDLIAESDDFHGKRFYPKTRSEKEYRSRYRHRKYASQKLGDATPIYAYSKLAAKNIHKHNPQTKIIIMLRHPVEFLQAMHMQYVNDGSEDEPDFEKALRKEALRKQGKSISRYAMCPSLHYYRERATYYKQVKRYFDTFPENQILILLFEDFRKDNAKTYREVTDFLGVWSDFQPDFKTINASQAPRSRALHRALNNMALKNLLYRSLGAQRYTKVKKGVMKFVMKKQPRKRTSDDVRKQLLKETRTDVEKLGNLIDKDLFGYWNYK